MGRFADELIAELDSLPRWPPPRHFKALQRVSRGIAMRERDVDSLRAMAGWDEGRRSDQRFLCDPMPSRISSAFTGLVFGRQPEFGAANDADQPRMDDMVKENNFKSGLHRAGRTNSSEGEVWWRIIADPELADHALVEWHSRTSVYPLWRAERLQAVAFVTLLEDHDRYRWRLFEVHEFDRGTAQHEGIGGRVENVLYRERLETVDGRQQRSGPDVVSAVPVQPLDERDSNRAQTLGERVDLSMHPETEGLDPEWNHGLSGMLGGRVVNVEGVDPTIGTSDYWDPEDWLVELNIAASIAHANMELTARRRVIVPEEMVVAPGGVDGIPHPDKVAQNAVDIGEQVFTGGTLDRSMGEGGAGSGAPYKVLEYSFDAEALIAYKREIEVTALNRIGIDAQFAGLQDATGPAQTGVALRIRLIPSKQAGEERGQDWDDQLPRIVGLMQQVEALSIDAGGFGRPWQAAQEDPTVDRGDPLPEDRFEGTERRASAVTASIMSRRRAVEEDHPDWTDTEVDDELALIDEDIGSTSFDPFAATLPPTTTSPDQTGGGTDLPAQDAQTTSGGPDQQGAGADPAASAP